MRLKPQWTFLTLYVPLLPPLAICLGQLFYLQFWVKFYIQYCWWPFFNCFWRTQKFWRNLYSIALMIIFFKTNGEILRSNALVTFIFVLENPNSLEKFYVYLCWRTCEVNSLPSPSPSPLLVQTTFTRHWLLNHYHHARVMQSALNR